MKPTKEKNIQRSLQYGTIHLRRQHVLGGEGYPYVPMVKRSQYIKVKNPLHKQSEKPESDSKGDKLELATLW